MGVFLARLLGIGHATAAEPVASTAVVVATVEQMELAAG